MNEILALHNEDSDKALDCTIFLNKRKFQVELSSIETKKNFSLSNLPK